MGDIGDLLGGGINPDDVDGADFEPIPVGWYPVMIDNAEVKKTKAGDGAYILLEMSVLGGDHNGRKMFDRLNIVNKNPEAVKYAVIDLAKIAKALGIANIDDAAQLLNGQLEASVKIDKKEDGDLDNVVKGYRGLKDAVAPATPTATQAPAAATKTATATPPPVVPATPSARPWEK